VFTTTVGTVIEPPNLAGVLDALIVEAGVRRIRLHDMRHTCASLLLAQGVPARVVMKVLGHSQLGSTINLYSHVMSSVLREAAKRSTARWKRLRRAWTADSPYPCGCCPWA